MKRICRLSALAITAITALSTTISCNRTGYKIGLLCLHGETSMYDKNFIDAFKSACAENDLKEGIDYEIRTDVSEDYNSIVTAAKEWAEDGYSLIFADSFGHQYGLIDVAKIYPNTEFFHATGTNAITNKLDNYHSAFADIFVGRYLSGVAAGVKMGEDVDAGKYKEDEAKIGYIGAKHCAEVISGYTSFYLGAKKGFSYTNHNPNKLTMDVAYTDSWYDYGAEKDKADLLINRQHCKLISQHADSMGAPQTCALNNIPNVTYNIDTKIKTPNTYLCGSKINWKIYFNKIIDVTKRKYYEKGQGKPQYQLPYDYSGTLPGGDVEMLEFGDIADKKVRDIVNNEIVILDEYLYRVSSYIFDCRNFTVSLNKNPDIASYITIEGNKQQGHIEKYLADVIDDGKYIHDTNVIKQSTDSATGQDYYYFAESEYDESKYEISESLRSAPFFDLIIDGINRLN